MTKKSNRQTLQHINVCLFLYIFPCCHSISECRKTSVSYQFFRKIYFFQYRNSLFNLTDIDCNMCITVYYNICLHFFGTKCNLFAYGNIIRTYRKSIFIDFYKLIQFLCTSHDFLNIKRTTRIPAMTENINIWIFQRIQICT